MRLLALAFCLLSGVAGAQPFRTVPDTSLPVASSMARTDTMLCLQGSALDRCSVAQVLKLIQPSDLPQTFGAISGLPSGQFYADRGANVARIGDRLLVGAAADNPAQANRDALPRDWLSGVMGPTSIGAYPVWGAQGASLARYGTIGFLAASRTSDARGSAAMLGYTPASIGNAGWCINDDTANPTTTTCWAGYDEAWRMPGVGYQPTFGREIETVNFGGLPVGVSNPFHVNVGGGTYGVQIGCGGGQTSGTSDCGGALTVVRNPQAYQTGITFGANALTGTNGTDSGYAEAIGMGRNQALTWHTPETVGGVTGLQTGAFIRSSVSQFTLGQRVEFQDNALIVTNSSGQLLTSISVSQNPTSALNLQAGNGAGAPGIYTQQGAGGSANLGLYPASGGEIQTQGPVTATGSAPAGSPAFGWLHVNVNGVDARVPLYSPAQAGG